MGWKVAQTLSLFTKTKPLCHPLYLVKDINNSHERREYLRRTIASIAPERLSRGLDTRENE